MNKTVPYVIKPDSNITVYINGECVTVTKDHTNYAKIVEVLKSKDHSTIEKLVNLVADVISYTESSGKVKIVDGQVYYGEYPVNTTLTTRILDMMKQGFKFDHMVKFLENLMANPSKRAVEEAYRFLENYGMPITDDGHFLAYKAVNHNYMDIYSGKFDNHVGKTPEMPRNFVDEDYNKDCSRGLHVGALDYVVTYGHFTKGKQPDEDGNHLMIVKVNPADIVSVPEYEKYSKMRVCKYHVISEITDVVKELDKVVYSGKNATALDPDMEENDDSEFSKPRGTVEDFHEGYEDGSQADFLEQEYPSEDEFETEAYSEGFYAGYHGYEMTIPEDLESEDNEDSCDCCQKCCECESCDDENTLSESEYSAGRATGEHDARKGLPYQENFPIDASDEFKSGYLDGWESAR